MKLFCKLFVAVLCLSCVEAIIAQTSDDEALNQKVKAYLSGINQPVKVLEEAAQAYWSPDGTQIVYTRKAGNTDTADGLSILTLDGSGKTRKLTENGKDPVWSSDGSWIAFVRGRADKETIYVISATGEGEAKEIVKGGYPNWFPDSKRILYHSLLTRDLMSINFENEEDEVLIEDFPYHFPTLSPDGKKIAFALPGVGILFSTLDGDWGKHIELDNFYGFLGRWSPDNERVVYGGFINAPLSLSVVNHEEDTSPNVLTPQTWSRPAWSPDGEFIVCDTSKEGDYSVWIIRLSTLMYNRI